MFSPLGHCIVSISVPTWINATTLSLIHDLQIKPEIPANKQKRNRSAESDSPPAQTWTKVKGCKAPIKWKHYCWPQKLSRKHCYSNALNCNATSHHLQMWTDAQEDLNPDDDEWKTTDKNTQKVWSLFPARHPVTTFIKEHSAWPLKEKPRLRDNMWDNKKRNRWTFSVSSSIWHLHRCTYFITAIIHCQLY